MELLELLIPLMILFEKKLCDSVCSVRDNSTVN